MRDVAIIGGGASGIYAALLLADKRPDLKITIFEKETKLGKKLCATGNGHCNLLNADYSPKNYNANPLVSFLINLHPFSELLQCFEKLGIPLFERNGLYYPANYHAPSFVDYLTRQLTLCGVEIRLGESVLDYAADGDGYSLRTNNGIYSFKNIIFASGGKSSPKLGSDGSLFAVLAHHGYYVTELSSGLAPIRVKEKIRRGLDGERHSAEVSIHDGDKKLFTESGEVLYKKDGLSGIVIFNADSFILHHHLNDPQIRLDLFPGEDIAPYLLGGADQCLLTKPLYEEAVAQAEAQGVSLAEACHHFRYRYLGSYDFDDSQVTIGGVDLSEVSDSLESYREKHVYFIGECLDVDGFCGGFNLTWALLSALAVSVSIGKK